MSRRSIDPSTRCFDGNSTLGEAAVESSIFTPEVSQFKDACMKAVSDVSSATQAALQVASDVNAALTVAQYVSAAIGALAAIGTLGGSVVAAGEALAGITIAQDRVQAFAQQILLADIAIVSKLGEVANAAIDSNAIPENGYAVVNEAGDTLAMIARSMVEAATP